MPSTCKCWTALGLNVWVVFDSSRGCCLGYKSFGKMFIWKKQSSRELLLGLAPVGTNTESLIVENTFQEEAKSNFFPFMWAVQTKVDNVSFLCKRTDERKNRHFHEVLLWFELAWESTGERLYPCTLLFIHLHLPCPSLPSFPASGPKGHWLLSMLRGPVFSGCWQHVADRLCSLF